MIVVMILLYLLPTFIAILCGRRNWFAIMILNFLFGWTYIGWAIALIWSFITDK